MTNCTASVTTPCEDEVITVELGVMGPPGPMGGALLCTAGATVGGHRVVVIGPDGKVQHANASDLSHAGLGMGLTTCAAAEGESVVVVVAGEVNEPSWSWAASQPIYLSDNGQLTQTPPSTGALIQVGYPSLPTRMLISFSTPVFLI